MMPSHRLSRRRVITIVGASGGACLASGAVLLHRRREPPEPLEWHGIALGAPAHIVLYHDDPAAARSLLAGVGAEIHRLESEFSLYRRDSALSRLNRDGRLDRPSPDLLALLGTSAAISEATEGAFDPTVQPVWTTVARSFRDRGAPPGADDLHTAVDLVGWDRVAFDRREVRFGSRGMALTFNGIAQGYITDRIADRLRDGGLRHVLVELGETRAIGAHPERRPWEIGIPDPDGHRLIETVQLADEAIATSGGYGTSFDSEGAWHHLFDPNTGRSAQVHRSVSVIAPTATEADALATAFAILPEDAAARVARGRPGIHARVVDQTGTARALRT